MSLVLDEHFERAARGGAESGAGSVQNAVQKPAALLRTESRNPQESWGKATLCDSVRDRAEVASYPARTRTWNGRTKTSCVTNYTTG